MHSASNRSSGSAGRCCVPRAVLGHCPLAATTCEPVPEPPQRSRTSCLELRAHLEQPRTSLARVGEQLALDARANAVADLAVQGELLLLARGRPSVTSALG